MWAIQNYQYLSGTFPGRLGFQLRPFPGYYRNYVAMKYSFPGFAVNDLESVAGWSNEVGVTVRPLESDCGQNDAQCGWLLINRE